MSEKTLNDLQRDHLDAIRNLSVDRLLLNAISRLETIEFQVARFREKDERPPDLWYEAMVESAFCAKEYVEEVQRRAGVSLRLDHS